jgi:ATP-binding cassette subfamily B protein/subfamily B ATP-binding cassette protein MsbA
MKLLSRSSRRQYEAYRRELKDRRASGAARRHHSSPGPAAAYRRSRSFFTLFVQFLKMLEGHGSMLVLAMATLTVSVFLELVSPYGFKLAVDHVIDAAPMPAWLASWLPVSGEGRGLLIFIAGAIVLLTATGIAIQLWGRWQTTRITQRIRVSIRRKAFEHAVRLPLHRVYSLKSGGASSLIREDAGGVADLLFAMIYNPWAAIVQLVSVLTILAFVEWRLLLGAIVLLPVVFLTHRTWIARIRPLYSDIRATRQQIDGQVTEAFGGIRVVRSFSRQRTEANSFITHSHFMARQELFAWWWNRGVDVAWKLLIPTAVAAALCYGGMRIMDDRALVAAGKMLPQDALTIGDLVMFLGYLGSLLQPLAALAFSATQFQNSLAGLDRVLDLLEEPRESPPRPGAVAVDGRQVAGRVALHDVTFTYPSCGEPALQQVSLEVLPGQTVALVGPSGAGKTTLCNLIARFYDPDQGAITLDGTDLRDIQVDSYRRLLAIVEQDIFLFDGTVAANIAYGRRGATQGQVARAAELAHADEFIRSLPHGYETWVGERGVKLSGGQRQRLAIARALLADPRILILDEATSNLDTESERLIQASLGVLMAHRTCFVIAHRLSTITHADQIVVLENGRIIETGRHDELIARSGRYRMMVDMQLKPVSPQEQGEDDEDASIVGRMT